MAMLDKVKAVLGVTDPEYDEELEDLIAAAKMDLGIAGITQAEDTDNPLIIRGIILYCSTHFGAPENFDKLLQSYETLKGQLMCTTGFTDWGSEDDA
jgi:hypothetical protein